MFRFTLVETDKYGRLETDVPFPEPFTKDAEAVYHKAWTDSFKPVSAKGRKKRTKPPATKLISRTKSGNPRPVRASAGSRKGPAST